MVTQFVWASYAVFHSALREIKEILKYGKST